MWFLRIRYAKEFKCDPQTVGAVPLRWWYRWLMYEQSEHAAQAFEHASHAENFVTELSKSELRAMNWLSEHDG